MRIRISGQTLRSWALAAFALLAAAPPALAAEAAEGGEYNIFAGDIGNAIWTVVIFVVVLFVLGRYAWGPMLERLQARESFIRESLEDAKAKAEAAEAKLVAYEQQLADARAEATAIVEEGRRDADVVRGKLEQQAKDEAEKMIARAKREIDIAKETAVKDLYARADRLATEAAARIIQKELTPGDHERLIRESIERIESSMN